MEPGSVTVKSGTPGSKDDPAKIRPPLEIVLPAESQRAGAASIRSLSGVTAKDQQEKQLAHKLELPSTNQRIRNLLNSPSVVTLEVVRSGKVFTTSRIRASVESLPSRLGSGLAFFASRDLGRHFALAGLGGLDLAAGSAHVVRLEIWLFHLYQIFENLFRRTTAALSVEVKHGHL